MGFFENLRNVTDLSFGYQIKIKIKLVESNLSFLSGCLCVCKFKQLSR